MGIDRLEGVRDLNIDFSYFFLVFHNMVQKEKLKSINGIIATTMDHWNITLFIHVLHAFIFKTYFGLLLFSILSIVRES